VIEWLNLAGAIAVAVGIWRGVEKILKEWEEEEDRGVKE
jgi:hypothetical protein